jgi:hypothetical protein
MSTLGRLETESLLASLSGNCDLVLGEEPSLLGRSERAEKQVAVPYARVKQTRGPDSRSEPVGSSPR